MTRYFFLAALCLIAVVSCSKENDNNSTGSINKYDSNSINFVTQATKAISNNIDTMQADANGFVVYGLQAGVDFWHENLDGNNYIYDSIALQWAWATTETPSWPEPFNQMNFYAFYPESAEGFILTAIDGSSITGDIVVEPSILDQTDYLASCSGDVASKPSGGMQSLNFEHIMSKISFSITQDDSVLTVIRQLGMENIISEGSYDYMNSVWYNLSNENLASFSDYVGSSGPFAKYGVDGQVDQARTDGHSLMLIPQSGGEADDQTPLWDGSTSLDDGDELVPSGAYVSIRYRTNSTTEDIVGYAFRDSSPNETEWPSGVYYYNVYKKGGTYTGPLFVKAAFILSSGQLDWVSGTEYNYTIQLNKTGGIHLSEYYYDVDGTNTKIRISGTPKAGDTVYTTDMSVGVTVNGWK